MGTVELRSGEWKWFESVLFDADSGEIRRRVLCFTDANDPSHTMERGLLEGWTDYEEPAIAELGRQPDSRRFTDGAGRKWVVNGLTLPRMATSVPSERDALSERIRLTSGDVQEEAELPPGYRLGDLRLDELMTYIP